MNTTDGAFKELSMTPLKQSELHVYFSIWILYFFLLFFLEYYKLE